MKKEKEKEKYESPQTKKTQVSLESGFMCASVDVRNPDKMDNGRIEEHKVNDEFGFNFTDQGWEKE